MFCIKVARFIIVVFNSVLFAFGIALLVCGLTVQANNFTVFDDTDKNYAQALHVIEIPDVMGNTAIFMATAGSVAILISILGCCAVAIYNRHAFLVYWIVLIILVLFEIFTIIYVLVYPEQRKTEICEKMYESLKLHFIPISDLRDLTWEKVPNVRSEESETNYWLMMEMRFDCCGAYDYRDYQTFFWNNITQLSGQNVSASVPVQCCMHETNGMLGSSLNVSKCLAGELKHINTKGCSDVVMSAVRLFGVFAVTMVAVVVAIQVILISAAIYLWMTTL